jgi:exopolysaccharide biosynthesis predicted pyruvyltransferase EpsI
MNFYDKISMLNDTINERLSHLINSNYVLYDIPFYNNVGDLLIWEGELHFLKKIKYKRINSFSAFLFKKDQHLPSNIIILLQGGGNFGDIWRVHQEFRLKIIQEYPNNKIIIFPQTVYYQNHETMLRDAEIMRQHKNLTICARDMVSYNLLKKYFNNNILLVPDMAFCIPPKQLLSQTSHNQTNKTLYLKREDKEFKNGIKHNFENHSIDAYDWPCMTHNDFVQILFKVFLRLKSYKLSLWYAQHIYKWYLIKNSVKFISQYKEIYTTRLHTSILCTLLGKKHHILDNSYGKNKNFYDTWFQDLEGIEFIDTKSN